MISDLIDRCAEAEALASTETMPFSVPLYSRKQVNNAGEALLKEYDWDELNSWLEYTRAIEVVNNWRAAHSGPLLFMRMLLTRQAKRIDANALIAQRIKRLLSIELKLSRFTTMKLSQMQDIGGCRAIVGSVAQVRELAENFQTSKTKNQCDHIDDYITVPQSTGYRGIHLIYKFFTDGPLRPCNNLKIEVQLRSPLQHAWATAVETVGDYILYNPALQVVFLASIRRPRCTSTAQSSTTPRKPASGWKACSGLTARSARIAA